MFRWPNLIKARIASLRASHAHLSGGTASLPPQPPQHYVPPPPVSPSLVRAPTNWGQAAVPVQGTNLAADVTKATIVETMSSASLPDAGEWPTGLPKPPQAMAATDKDTILARDPIYNQARIAITSALAFYNDRSIENLLTKIHSPAERRLITEIYALVRRKSDGP